MFLSLSLSLSLSHTHTHSLSLLLHKVAHCYTSVIYLSCAIWSIPRSWLTQQTVCVCVCVSSVMDGIFMYISSVLVQGGDSNSSHSVDPLFILKKKKKKTKTHEYLQCVESCNALVVILRPHWKCKNKSWRTSFTVHSEIFSQTLFDFKRMVSHSISPKFSGKIPYVLSKPRICF